MPNIHRSILTEVNMRVVTRVLYIIHMYFAVNPVSFSVISVSSVVINPVTLPMHYGIEPFSLSMLRDLFTRLWGACSSWC